MTASAAPLEATLAWLGLATRGWGLVVAPPGEQRRVAEALGARVPGCAVVALSAALLGDAQAPPELGAVVAPGGGVLFVDPVVDLAAELATWRALNGRRDWLADRGVWVLVVSHRQLTRLTAHAGDLASVARRCEVVPFVARALDDDELEAARAALHAHYQRRFGRLDLRGFIRSEREDVSFPVEAIYQPLRATSDPRYPIMPPPREATTMPGVRRGEATWTLAIVELLAARCARDPRVPGLADTPACPTLLVGGPGSGKTFFLRHCALAASGAAHFAGQDRPLPIYLSLAAVRARDVGRTLLDEAIDDLLEAGLAAVHAVIAEAEAGRALFLIDGLDEVGDARGAVAAQVAALAARFPRCSVIVTSRPGGLTAVDLDAIHLGVAPLDDLALTALLGAWCELYEVERSGAAAGSRGRAEGEELAREVLESPAIASLAGTPLLATILAIVHRAGVRLPERRVELYEHMTRVLVERWNQLRSHQADASPPIRVADAIRLIGPVALRLVEQGRDGAVDEDALRGLLEGELARGAVRAFADAASAIATFRDSLGLLVEHAPQIYGFLHKTLAEFLAAHELVRTGRLETLIASGEGFAPRWHEVVLLALGLVGTVHVDDRRLAANVMAMVAAAHARRAERSEEVPALLAGVLVDDPDLTPVLADAIVDELVPAWWFDALPEDLEPFRRVRDSRGRWGDTLERRIRAAYADGLRMALTNRDESERLLPIYLALNEPEPVPGPRWFCEWSVRWAVSSWAFSSLTVVAFRGVALDGHAVKVDRGYLAAYVTARLVALGFGQAICVGGGFEMVEVTEVHEREAAPSAPSAPLYFWIESPHSTEGLRLLPALLDLWREIAARDPDGPAPPASVEEAYAIYGPRPRPAA